MKKKFEPFPGPGVAGCETLIQFVRSFSAEVRGKMEDVSSTAAGRGEFAQQNPMAQQQLAPIPACITNAEVLSKLEEVRRLVESGLVKAEVYELLLAQLRQHDGAPEEGLTPIPASMTDVEVRSKLEEVRSLVANGLVKAEVYELLLAQQHHHGGALEEVAPIPASIIDVDLRSKLEEVRSLVANGLVKAEI